MDHSKWHSKRNKTNEEKKITAYKKKEPEKYLFNISKPNIWIFISIILGGTYLLVLMLFGLFYICKKTKCGKEREERDQNQKSGENDAEAE